MQTKLDHDFMLTVLGHEPHQLVRHHSRPAVRLVHHAVLRPRDGPAGARPHARLRDGRSPTDAQCLPAVPGRQHGGCASHQALLQIRRQDTHLLQVWNRLKISGVWLFFVISVDLRRLICSDGFNTIKCSCQ